MPNYIDKDYNESEQLRTDLYNRFLGTDFKEIKFYQATSTLLEAQIVIENCENPYVVIYKIYNNLNHYEIIPIGFVKLHKSEEKYYTVCGSYCEEFYRGSHFITSLYYSLFKNGILLQSDFVQMVAQNSYGKLFQELFQLKYMIDVLVKNLIIIVLHLILKMKKYGVVLKVI